MKVQYFSETDTLYIEFNRDAVAETRELDENTMLDVDVAGKVCAITFEHASERTDLNQIELQGIAA